MWVGEYVRNRDLVINIDDDEATRERKIEDSNRCRVMGAGRAILGGAKRLLVNVAVVYGDDETEYLCVNDC